jgi:HEAT repeat protein
MHTIRRLAPAVGLAAALALGLALGAWSGGWQDLAARRQRILQAIPADPDILINVESPETPGTPDLTRLGRTATPALRAGLLGNVDDELRQRFAEVLTVLRDPAAVPDLVAALRDRSVGVRSAALRALGQIGARDAIPHVLGLAADPEQPAYAVTVAIETLGRLGGPKTASFLEKYVNEEAPMSHHGAALEALWRMRNEVGRGRLEGTFRRALAFVDPYTLEDVVARLGWMKATGAVDDLVARFPGAPEGLQNRIVIALGDIGDDDARPFLLGLLGKTQNGRLLSNSAIALRKVGAQGEAIAALRGLLADPKAYIRINAAFALGEIGDERAFDALTAALKDKNDYVRSETAVALGRVGDPRVLPALEEAARDPNPFVRLDAVVALNRIDFATYRPLLDALLSEKAERIRTRAVRFLAERGDTSVLDDVVALARSAPLDHRIEAVQALARMEGVPREVITPVLLHPLLTQPYAEKLQRAILLVIREQGLVEATGLLVEQLHHSWGENRRRVLFTLGRLESPDLLGRLPAVDAVEEPQDRLYLAYARARHGDAAASETLFAGLTRGAVGEKRDAAFLLRHVDDRALEGRVRELLSDPDPLVRLAAAHALLSRDFESMMARLYEGLADPLPVVADEAERTLRRLEGDAVDAWLQGRRKGERHWAVAQRVEAALYAREDRQFR